MTARLAALALSLALVAPACRADDAPADPFASPEDPFAAPPSAAPPPTFDPDAVIAAPRGLILPLPGPLGEVVVHGRANASLAVVAGRERVELLDRPRSIELSSADLYAEWLPCRWFALLGEVEVEDDLEELKRHIELDLELLVAELRPLGDERVRLRAGWAPTPFGIERRYYSPPRNEAVTRPAAFRRVFPGTASDLGATVWIQQPLGLLGAFELEVGLTRGLDGPGRFGRVEAFATDEDHTPQVSGRAGWTLVDVDPALHGDLPFRLRIAIGGSALQGGYLDGLGEHHDIRMAGADAVLQLGDLQLRGEVIQARVEHGDPGPGGPPELLRGGYLTACLRHAFGLPGLEEGFVVVRHDRLDPGRLGVSALSVERWYAGLGWSPLDGLLIKAGWERTRSRTSDGREHADAALFDAGYSF